MHFAYPGRKTSSPPPYAARRTSASTAFSALRKSSRLQPVGLAVVGTIATIWLVWRMISGGSGTAYVPPGTPKVVIVTTFDMEGSKAWQESVKDNRRDYASRHGYATFFTNHSSYSVGTPSTPKTWTILPSLRHAMALYPHTPYLFYLAPTALIMNPSATLQSHIVSPLESIMLTDRSVVPPDSVIKTFNHLRPENIDLILTQDDKGLSPNSMLLRSGEWTRYLLDAWFDPLYRSYNFQKAERHALEHIVQWHGTILSRLALIPQRRMNAYAVDEKGRPTSSDANNNKDKNNNEDGGNYQEGDFVANFHGCDRRQIEDDKPVPKGKKAPPPKVQHRCESEMAPAVGRWRELIDKEGRGRGAS